MSTERTIAKIEHGDSVTISIVPKDDGRWFRVLNRLIDAEYWALLPDIARNVLIVLARHRDENGLAKADIAALCRGSKLSRGTVYKALAALQSHTPPLIAKHGPELWELFPGWAFATRKPESPPGESSLQRENPVSGGRLGPLARSESSVFPSVQPKEKQTTTTDAGAKASPERAAVVAVLLREGFTDQEAAQLAASVSPGQVRKAVANADEMQRRALQSGKAAFRTGRREYISAAIRGNYALFSVLEERAGRKLAAKIRACGEAGQWPLDDEATARLQRHTNGDCRALLRDGTVTPAEIEELNELELVGVIAERAGVKKP